MLMKAVAMFLGGVTRGEGDCSAIQDAESRFLSLSRSEVHDIRGIFGMPVLQWISVGKTFVIWLTLAVCLFVCF